MIARHTALPVAMGAMMGMMVPWMLHMDARAGIGFVLAHFAIVLFAASLGLLLPRLRRRVFAHFRAAHVLRKGAGAAFGFAATCLFCLAIGGQHWT